MVTALGLGYLTMASATDRAMLLGEELSRRLRQSKLLLDLGTIHLNSFPGFKGQILL